MALVLAVVALASGGGPGANKSCQAVGEDINDSEIAAFVDAHGKEAGVDGKEVTSDDVESSIWASCRSAKRFNESLTYGEALDLAVEEERGEAEAARQANQADCAEGNLDADTCESLGYATPSGPAGDQDSAPDAGGSAGGQAGGSADPGDADPGGDSSGGTFPAGPEGEFQSPSGNIHCAWLPSDARIRCDVLNQTDDRDPEPKPGSCDYDWGQEFILGPDMTRGQMACGSDSLADPSAAVLPYGSTWERHGITCTSEEDGVTCRAPAGGGLFLNRERQELLGS